jgi:hypothetical protein
MMEERNFKPKQEREPSEHEKNIQEVFRMHPELEAIGDQKAYAKYLKTIFPDSKMKEIVWHGSKSKEEFDHFIVDQNSPEHAGIFFSKSLKDSYDGKAYRTVPALLNINPYYVELAERAEFRQAGNIENDLREQGFDSADIERGGFANEIQVFDPARIRILGSKSDLEGFKKFVASQSA